ncbi:MAG: hypothetical protein HDS68_00095 [Bacteroidales bacterium]|nr:hypothetical protein [Bacteroidales bacterium]
MKIIYKYAAILTALIICHLSTNASQLPDTITVTSPSSVSIIETPEGLSVRIREIDNNGEPISEEQTMYSCNYGTSSKITSRQRTFRSDGFDVNLFSIGSSDKNNPKVYFNVVSGGLALGLVNAAGQPTDYGLQWGKSFEISWLNILAAKMCYRGFALSLGIGVDWRNYRMVNNSLRMLPNDQGGIATAPYPDGSIPKSSRIKIFSLGIPLLATQQISKNITLSGGAILNFNTHASLLTKYTSPEGNAISESATSIHHRRVSVDYFASLSWKWVGLYVRYSPHSVLMGCGSPHFNPMSAGIILGW